MKSSTDELNEVSKNQTHPIFFTHIEVVFFVQLYITTRLWSARNPLFPAHLESMELVSALRSPFTFVYININTMSTYESINRKFSFVLCQKNWEKEPIEFRSE